MSDDSIPWFCNPFLIVPLLTGAGFLYASYKAGFLLPVTGGAFFILLLITVMCIITGGRLLLIRSYKGWESSLPGTVLLLILLLWLAYILEVKVNAALFRLDPRSLPVRLEPTSSKFAANTISGERTIVLLGFCQAQLSVIYISFLAVLDSITSLLKKRKGAPGGS